MTLEELKEKYPVGSKVTVVPNASYREKYTPVYFRWTTTMDCLYGKTVEVVDHCHFNGLHNEVFLRVTNSSGIVWLFMPQWLEHTSAEDTDALLKKQRDDFLASVFGG